MAIELRVGANPEEATALALEVVRALRPRTLALSGGRTPQDLHAQMATVDFNWSDIDVFFADERCVPPDHVDSNYRLAHESLLSRVPARVHRMRGEDCNAEAYESIVRERLGATPVLDLALLGMGGDGHTASLFPGDPALEERERLVLRVERPDHPRLTLTLPVLTAARVALFLVTGEDKREAVRQLLDGDESIPATLVRAGRVVLVVDRAAAGNRG